MGKYEEYWENSLFIIVLKLINTMMDSGFKRIEFLQIIILIGGMRNDWRKDTIFEK